MSRGFIITTLLISIAALGICRPGRPYPKEPAIICGSVTEMENNTFEIANENANINFGSTTIMDGNNPCQGINYVRQMGTTYNGENSLPNENTSLRETHESYTGSDTGTWKSPQISETYDGENFLPNENPSLSYKDYNEAESGTWESAQSPETNDGENFLPKNNASMWETSESYTEANPGTWKYPLISKIFGREYFLPKNNSSLWDTSESFSGIDPGIWKYPETYSGENFFPKENLTGWEMYKSYTGADTGIWKSSQSPETYDGESFLPKENITGWEIYKSYTGSGPVIWNVTQSSETAQNILDSIEKKEGTLHNFPQYSLGTVPNNVESTDEFLNKGTIQNLPQNILDTVQNNLKSIEDPVDESMNTNGIEEEKKTPSDTLDSTNSQTGLVPDKLYMYLFSLIMLFQCKLF